MVSTRDVFAQELLKCRAVLQRAARARLRNPEWADDAVAETLLAALEARPPFAEPARLRAWLFGVLRHKVVDQLRLNLGAVESEAEGLPPDNQASDAPWGTDPQRALGNRQFLNSLGHQLARLPARQAQAFMLCHALGHSTEEACAELGLSPGALWVTLHRARVRLQQGLLPYRD